MQSMQRQLGRLRSKNPGGNAKVLVLLHEYEDADKLLLRIIENYKSWRDTWVSLVSSQLQVATEYEGLYDPIVGVSSNCGRDALPTPGLQLTRTLRLKESYADLKLEVMDELGLIDKRILKPATEAQACIQPIRKTIKKRENKRLDYEQCQDKVLKLQRKSSRTPREELSLTKAEEELANLADDFGIADGHLCETLPPVISAAFSLIQPLLQEHIKFQNRLLGLYYTALHGYCEDHGFPSPPPPMDEVTTAWALDFRPVQRQIESISCIARGKAVHQPMGPSGGSHTTVQVRKSPAIDVPEYFKRPTSNATTNSDDDAPRLTSPHNSSIPPIRSSAMMDQSSLRPGYFTPTDFTMATKLAATVGQVSSRMPSDSLTANRSAVGMRQPVRLQSYSTTTPSFSSTSSTPASHALTSLSIASIKKKAPPPPPPKKISSSKPKEYAIAMFNFEGQGEGDLAFREGDRIQIIQKTDTDQDWWVGELRGVRGSFPANYCRLA